MEAIRRHQAATILVVAAALGGMAVSAALLKQHTPGWRAVPDVTGFLLRFCDSPQHNGAECADVVTSHWGWFDFHVGTHLVVVPTALIGLAYFALAIVWFGLGVPIVARSRLLWRLTLIVACGALVFSGFLTGLMALSPIGWCRLCAIAHGLNAGMVLGIILLWRLHRTSTRTDTISTTGLQLWVAALRRRLTIAVMATGVLAGVGAWAYFDAVTEVRRQWHKLANARSVIAELQHNPTFMLREYLAQPVVDFPARAAHDDVAAASFRPEVMLFTDYACRECTCSELRLLELIQGSLGDRARLEIHALGATLDEGRAAEPQPSPANLASVASRLQGGERAQSELHELLFRHKGKRAPDDIIRIAQSMGLDAERLTADMKTPSVRASVADDRRLATALGVTSTPAVFLDGRRVPDLCVQSSVFWQEIARLMDERQASATP